MNIGPETERRLETRRLAAMLNHAPIATAVVDAFGTLVWVNLAFSRLVRRPETELRGSRFAELVDRDATRLALPTFPQPPGGPGLERRIRCGDGSSICLRFSSSVVPTGDGEATYAIVQAEDISAAKTTEQTLNRLGSVLDAATETAIIGTDPDGLITVFNRGAERMFGWTAEELVGRHSPAVLHEPQQVVERAAEMGVEPGFEVLVHSARQGCPETREWTYLHSSGTPVAVALTVTCQRRAGGEIEGFLAVGSDLSATHKSELARHQAEGRFRAAFQHAPIGVALTRIRGPQRGRFLETNAALARIVGREPGELDGVEVETLTHPSDHGSTEAGYARVASGETIAIEKRYIHTDGREIWVLVSSTPVPTADGSPPDIAVTQVVDISEHKLFEGQLQHLADHDALTGLFNRHRFDVELKRIVSETHRYDRRGALMMLDLDGFKDVNDRFGHPVGDELVTRTGVLLRQLLRDSDVVARLGGDEFAIVLHEAGEPEALDVAGKVLDAVRQHGVVMRELRQARVTLSIGLTVFDGECDVTADELVVEAESAMYDAKAAGRDRCSVYDRVGNRRAVVSERPPPLS